MPDTATFKTVLGLIEKDDAKILGLTFGERNVKPSDKIPKEEAQETPKLTWRNTLPGSKFVVVCLDLDAPFPSFAVLSPILHWLQAGFTVVGDDENSLKSSDPPMVVWAGPGPPAISSPHRYVFLLYDQPREFESAAFAKPHPPQVSMLAHMIRDRMRWDLSRFEREAKLGPAVAATYFSSH